LQGRTVVIDPGHNGGNPGATDQINRLVDAVTLRKPCDTTGAATEDGYPESAFNLDVARRLHALLTEAGATVVLTRQGDDGVGPCIDERAAIGNQAGGIGISIHADGGPAGGRGFHVIQPALVPDHTDGIVEPSHELALALRASYETATGMPRADYIANGGLDTRDDLGGLNLSTIPKVFIECANLRNAQDAALVQQPAFRQKAAQGIFDGLSQFFAASG
jgi:N-acetylmuramoyl-L-alanine amidase